MRSLIARSGHLRHLQSAAARWSSELAKQPDKIMLKGLVFHAYHGAAEEERSLGQKFVVDLELERDLRVPSITDDVKDTIDYAQVYRVAQQVVQGGEKSHLLETVADRLAREVFSNFDANSIRVRIKKPQVAVEGVVDHLGVEVCRYRDEYAMPGSPYASASLS